MIQQVSYPFGYPSEMPLPRKIGSQKAISESEGALFWPLLLGIGLLVAALWVVWYYRRNVYNYPQLTENKAA
jgi:hypothetical protein